MLGAVELLRVVAVPPLPFAVDGREAAVVRNTCTRAGAVGTVRRLKPPPVARLMHCDAEPQAPPARRLCPRADHIAMRSDVARVPRVVRRIPGVETIVMVGQCEEQLRTGTHVEVHELRGLPIEKCPLCAQVLVSELRRMAIVLELVVVLLDLAAVSGRALNVHVAAVPIAVFRHALRAPVIPDTELGVAI